MLPRRRDDHGLSEVVDGVWNLFEVEKDEALQSERLHVTLVEQAGLVREVDGLGALLVQVAVVAQGDPGLGMFLRNGCREEKGYTSLMKP